jgi:hypothetical protein
MISAARNICFLNLEVIYLIVFAVSIIYSRRVSRYKAKYFTAAFSLPYPCNSTHTVAAFFFVWYQPMWPVTDLTQSIGQGGSHWLCAAEYKMLASHFLTSIISCFQRIPSATQAVSLPLQRTPVVLLMQQVSPHVVCGLSVAAVRLST